MGRTTSGRWIAAAVLAAGVVGATLLAVRGCDEAGVPASPSGTTSPRAAEALPKHGAPRRVEPKAAASDDSTTATWTVWIRVLAAEDGSPIAGATVTLAETGASRTADADGIARFESISRGTLYCASAPGRVTRWSECAVRGVTLEMRLVPAVALEVRVEDRRNGAPIAGAKIDIDVVGQDTEDHGNTGDDGERLMLVPAGMILRVKASAPGFDEGATSARTGPCRTLQPPVVLRLVPEGRITGIVRTPNGLAVAHADVRAAPETLPIPHNDSRWDHTRVTRTELRAVTDATGRYEIKGVVRGRRYHAYASVSSYAWAESEIIEGIVVAMDGPDAVQDFRLRDYGTVVVRVTTADGSSAQGTALTLTCASGVSASTLGEDGVWHAGSWPPGPIAVHASTPVGTATRSALVREGGTLDLGMVLGPEETATYVVVDDVGRPVPSANIESRTPIGTLVLTTYFTTGVDGTVLLPVLDAGSRKLTIDAVGMSPLTVVSDSRSTDTVRVVMRRTSVLMFRILSTDGEPATSQVRILFGGDPIATEVSTALDGRARLECAARGEVDARLVFGIVATAPQRVTLSAGAVVDLGDVRSVVPCKLTGSVADATGRAIEGAHVMSDNGVDPSTIRPYPPTSSTVSNADGSFVVDFAPPSGLLPLRVRANGFVELRTVVTVDGDAPISLTLTRGGLLWGEIADGVDVPLPDATIHVLDARGADAATLPADRHGQFDVRLAPGRYTVRADGCDDVAVELREGADEHVRLIGRTR